MLHTHLELFFWWNFDSYLGTKNPKNQGIRTKLVVLSSNGGVLVQAPASYSQRMSGVLVGDASCGQATFTISGISKEDNGIYTCELYRIKSYFFCLKTRPCAIVNECERLLKLYTNDISTVHIDFLFFNNSLIFLSLSL